MSARDLARLYGAGRVALGAALLVAPRPLGALWLGPPGATPGGGVVLRALGVRDLVLGAMALHTLDHPEVAPRWQRTCAAVDAVDFAATAAARPALPRIGSVLVMGVAGAGAAMGAYLGSALQRGQ
jgi:hypothetical protein